jgi:DNA helicase TIP49 (TBP-interacting protein)
VEAFITAGSSEAMEAAFIVEDLAEEAGTGEAFIMVDLAGEAGTGKAFIMVDLAGEAGAGEAFVVIGGIGPGTSGPHNTKTTIGALRRPVARL